MNKVTLHGDPIEVSGNFPKKGDKIANFTLTNNELAKVALTDFAGKRKILNIFPSVDTGICANSVRKFNQDAASLNNVQVICISADLPFAQARFCGAEGINNVVVLSTLNNDKFRFDLGVAITSSPLAGLCARAVIVLDENDNVIYTQLVDEIKSEPDYSSALAVL